MTETPHTVPSEQADKHWLLAEEHTNQERAAYKQVKATAGTPHAKIWTRIQDAHSELAKHHDELARLHYAGFSAVGPSLGWLE